MLQQTSALNDVFITPLLNQRKIRHWRRKGRFISVLISLL